jgi:hypothetical protein
MEQHQRGSLPALDVVKANTVDCDEPSAGRVTPLGFLREPPIQQGGRHGDHYNTCRD